MLKFLTALTIGVLVSFSVAAHSDVGNTMHQMKTSYVQAMQAKTIPQMQTAIQDLMKFVAQAKQDQYHGDDPKAYQEGLSELSDTLTDIQHTLTKHDLDGAKAQLKKVDALRREYHKKTR